jgi:purine-nucleoside phosphorylase
MSRAYTSSLEQRIERAVGFIRRQVADSPKIGLILGSGLNDFTENLIESINIKYSSIPEFPVSTVEGHDGAFVFGNYNAIPIVALRGRLHYYEGYAQNEITMPIRVMKKLGVETLIITNAAGGINLDFSAGALMLITDHINYSGANPLIGVNLDEFGPRFPDVSDIYTKELRNRLKDVALHEGIALKEGVYIMYSGPNYETPAEIRFFREIGADAVGMSTVPEALVATHCGMKIIGVSCITNMATGVLDKKLSHQEVIETANRVRKDFNKLIKIAVEISYEMNN